MPIPTPQQIARYQIGRPNSPDVFDQPLYDRVAYAAGGQTSLTFFTVPRSGSKSLAKTNMTLAGQLPAPQRFLIEQIGIMFFPSTALSVHGAKAAANYINEVQAVLQVGFLELYVNNKPILQEGPLLRFPPGNQFAVQSSLADSSTAAADSQSRIAYAYASGAPRKLKVPIALMSSEAFYATLNWDAAVAVAGGGEIGIYLGGYLYSKG